MGYRDRFQQWPRYVPVAERREKAAKQLQKLRNKGYAPRPVVIEGRTIARTFWGKAWCDNLEAYSDFESRLPRGRTYARNGSVIDLQIEKGLVKAQVMGSDLYDVKISIKPMAQEKWRALVKECAGKIDSLIELLQSKFSKAVMAKMIENQNGLFPKPSEISMKCSCPDWADMCKHVAAVLYGVGARLDEDPAELFLLRHVNHEDLISAVSEAGSLQATPAAGGHVIAESDLSALFGIEIQGEQHPVAEEPVAKKAKAKPRQPKTQAKAKTPTKSAKPKGRGKAGV